MEFLNQRECVSWQLKIDQHNRESETLNELECLFGRRSQEHLPIPVEYFTGFLQHFWIMIDDENHNGLSV